ncbi:50S ribosomal protein L5 [Candidatus Parcubacteria bacterium]|nr:MAG: 50S ribosomal protein L5 [Candidatus Parcubacteria bacterium]
MADLKEKYKKEIVAKIQEKLKIKNPMAVPSLVKIVVNESTREFLADKKNIEKAREDLVLITGQKPKTTKARVSVATFKLREGDEIGLAVTLRGKRMYDFFEKLVKIVLPRVRDFSGISDKSFDKKGNLSIGFYEQTVFPEIDSGKVDKVRSMQITIVTDAGNDEKAKVLLEALGMPFKKV